jgi:CarD family transcriptional regulator
VIDADQVPKIFQILKEREIVPDNQTWNRRYREYMEKIKTGSVFELAEVLRDLFILREDKELSFGERKMLDTARGLLVKEISIAQDLEESQVEQIIRGIFSH